MIRGVIFDLDGVLLDSMPIWRDVGLRYLRSRGIEGEAELSDILFSMSMEEGAAYIREHYAIPLSEREILLGIGTLLKRFYVDEVQEKPGAGALMAFFREKGITMTAATSSPREHVTGALKRLGLLDYLQAIYTTGEIGESKQSPSIYRMAAEGMGCKKEETMVFEDSLYALKTAKKDGFVTVGVRDDEGEPDQEELKKAADYYLEALTDFRPV